MSKKFLFLSLSLILIVLISSSLFSKQIQGLEDERWVEFSVFPSQGVSQIAQKLFEEKLISSKFLFLAYTYFSGKFSQLKPGHYLLSPSLSLKEIVKILSQGPLPLEIVVYPGMTLKEIDELLAKNRIIKKGELLSLEAANFSQKFPFLSAAQSLEGFLMPDTYKFFPFSSPSQVAEIFLDNFWEKTKNLWGDLTKGEEIYKKVILASILEKEVNSFEDKKLVAGIILKRLALNMPLQVDASVVYGVCQGKFLDCPSLVANDFKRDFPHNTYLYLGLPPTPIANPSLESLKAALSPQKSDYLFYLSDPLTKKTVFSKTFQEHSQKRARYLGL